MQNIILVKSYDRQEIMIRGKDVNKKIAKQYGEYYLGSIKSWAFVTGETALALSLLNDTRIVDIDSDTIL